MLCYLTSALLKNNLSQAHLINLFFMDYVKMGNFFKVSVITNMFAENNANWLHFTAIHNHSFNVQINLIGKRKYLTLAIFH